MPVILHDFSYIPVNIAISPQSTNINEDKPVIGGTKFFNDIYKLLTIEKDEEEQELEKLNVIENEPLLYAPAF
ncbi:MAG: hypothetical protein MJ224_00060 [archaeon]|nr:hypothetical protein [archaeon]